MTGESSGDLRAEAALFFLISLQWAYESLAGALSSLSSVSHIKMEASRQVFCPKDTSKFAGLFSTLSFFAERHAGNLKLLFFKSF